MSDHGIRVLDELESEFARIAAAPVARRRRPGRLAAALATLALIGGSLLAVPPTRAALDSLADSFTAWISDDGAEAPGRALRPDDDVPPWVRDREGRVVAESGGIALYVSHDTTVHGTMLQFTFGGAAIADSPEGWSEQFDYHAAVVLGPGSVNGAQWDLTGRYPVFGVTAASVVRVELRYTTGPPLEARTPTGGFVLLADAERELDAIVAFDHAGRELERVDVAHLSKHAVCHDARGCPPGELYAPISRGA